LKQLETAQEVFNEAKAKLEDKTLAIEEKKQACKEDLAKIINDTTLYLTGFLLWCR
jgi:argonaute-like protein implicated in RNA metabolism and viral defense